MNDNSASLHFLQNLEPFTEYVVYVQTYGISITKDMARSELLHFKTKSDCELIMFELKSHLTFLLSTECNNLKVSSIVNLIQFY